MRDGDILHSAVIHHHPASRAMFALADANNFYASCERIFRPDLHGRPVAVLSNNDGCVIARSAELKALGVSMGAPWHQCRELFTRHGVEVFSANFALYGDMSARLMHLLRSQSALPMEVYSIDEAFLHVHQLGTAAQLELAGQLCATARRWLGLPISIGMAPSKTLAKLANQLAKRLDRPVLLVSKQDRRMALAEAELETIWGLGSRLCFRLRRAGINSPLDLAEFDPNWVRQEMGVAGQRLQLELLGQPCHYLEEYAPKKQIVVSRSFGRRVTCKAELGEALVHFGVRCAEKLRSQASLASWVSVQLYCPLPDKRWHSVSSGLLALSPTCDPRDISHVLYDALDSIYQSNTQYSKAGVTVSGLIPQARAQGDLFAGAQPGQQQLWHAVDAINRRYGRDTLRLAAQGKSIQGSASQGARRWHSRQQFRSPHYTTQWQDVLVVQA